MKKFFGIVIFMLLLFGISTASPLPDVGVAPQGFGIVQGVSVSVLKVETPLVLTSVSAESPTEYEVISYKQLKVDDVAPPLLSDVSIIPPLLLETDINFIPLFKTELVNLETNAEDVGGLTTVPLYFGSDVITTTNLFEVLFEYK